MVTMRSVARSASLLALLVPAVLGCQNNPFASTPGKAAWQPPPQTPNPLVSQLQDLDRRAKQLDANNRDLHTELAASKQQVELLQKRLADTANLLKETQLAKQDLEKRTTALQASMKPRGSATITANNSVQNSLKSVQVPGLEVHSEQDVIRIEIPSDKLFQVGLPQLLPGAYQTLDQVASAISANYPRQRIVIEGHTDSAPAMPGFALGNHKLTSDQAQAVFDVLTTRNRLPPNQLAVMSHGANHPRYSNGDPAGRAKNRRIELVVYPETIDGR
jgi:chemotaxis protein MotB